MGNLLLDYEFFIGGYFISIFFRVFEPWWLYFRHSGYIDFHEKTHQKPLKKSKKPQKSAKFSIKFEKIVKFSQIFHHFFEI
jgi:hypothetical protein